jgi:CubicO group peptidase (beta-lactamase class C family)
LSDLTGIENKKNIEDAGKFESLELLVNDYAKKEIRANAGTDFWYGGIGINIAARVVEIVTKKNFEQMIMQRIIRPLGMKSTTFSPENNRCVNPAGGALSTANDYLNFLSMLLNNGIFNGKQILSATAIEELKKIQVPANMIVSSPKGSENFSFGLGGCIMEKTTEEKATIIGCPNFAGIWPIIDLCRGYASIIFPKDYRSDAKKEIYTAFKETVDAELTSSCK